MVSGLITMPSIVLMTETPVAPARTTEPATATMSVTSGDSFAKIGVRGIAVTLDRLDDARRHVRIARQHLAPVLDVGAGDVDLDARDPLRHPKPRRELGVLVDGAAGDGHDRARAPVGEPGEVLLEEDIDARTLKPDRV